MVLSRTLFSELRTRARLGIAVEGVAIMVSAFAAFALLSFVVDRTFRLEVGYRLVLLLIFVAILGRLLHTRLWAPLSVPLDDAEMALAIERANPEVKQALISAVQFEDVLSRQSPTVESSQMMRMVVDEIGRRSSGMRTRSAVDGSRVRRWSAVLSVTLVSMAMISAVSPGTAAMWAARNLALSSTEWPRYTSLHFGAAGSDVLRVPEGDDLTLTVRAGGVVPDQAYLHYAFSGGETGAQAMTLTGDREFTLTLPSVLEDAVVYATGGDGVSPRLHVEVVERPRIEGLRATLEFPTYMQKEAEDLLEPEGDIAVPRGGGLVLEGRCSKRLVRAELVFGDDRRISAEVADDGRSFRARFEPTETGVLTLQVLDSDRLDTGRPPRLHLRMVEDRQPAVRFDPVGVGAMITPIARIPGKLEVRDDYGLRQVRAEYRLTGEVGRSGGEEDAPWVPADVDGLTALASGATAFEPEVQFDLRALHPDPDAPAEDGPVQPGQFAALRFLAHDNFGPGAPHIGESDAVVFRIVPRDKLLEDLSRRQSEQRRELEQIIDRVGVSLSELREILSPAADSPRAAAARLRVLALAREQRALGRRVRGVADNYGLILDEYLNNRMLEPGNVAEMRGQIVVPLTRLSEEDFPASATAVGDFAQTGEEDLRKVAVLSYESILQRLQQLLDHMQEAENFATLLEGLREAIKLQNAAIRTTEKQRSQELQNLFGPEDDKKERRDRK